MHTKLFPSVLAAVLSLLPRLAVAQADDATAPRPPPPSPNPGDTPKEPPSAPPPPGGKSEPPSLVATDNPGITNVSEAAPVGVLITEQLVSASFSGSGAEISAPNVLARVGVLEWLEVRAQLPSAVIQVPDQGDPRVDVDDVAFGFVVAGPLARSLTGSIVPSLTLPIDAPPGAAGVDGRVQGNLSHQIVERVSIGFAAATGWAHETDDDDAYFLYFVGTIFEVKPVRTLALFGQAYVETVKEDQLEPSAGGGVSWWVAPDVSLFVEANAGISEGSPPLVASAGAAVQWW